MNRVRRLLPAAVLLAGMIGVWELYSDLKGATFSTAILPAPHQVLSALYNDRALLWSNFLVTAKEVLLGILVASVLGAVLAVAIHFSPTLRRAMYPLLVASQAVPVPILAPMLVFWLGFGLLPKLV
ncbi:MAG: ABC transporter permease, partial [Solirubrobacteraceae bacterium]